MEKYFKVVQGFKLQEFLKKCGAAGIKLDRGTVKDSAFGWVELKGGQLKVTLKPGMQDPDTMMASITGIVASLNL